MKYDYISPVCLCMTFHAEGILCQSKETEEATSDGFGFGQDYDIL